MAPKRNVKEVAAASQTKVKRSKKDPLSQQLQEITSALKAAPIADEVKAMLTEVLPYSLGEYSDKRHRYQEQVIENVAAMMTEAEIDLNKKIEEAKSNHEEATSGKPLREKEAAHAAAQLEAAKAETQRLKVALADVALAFRAAQQSVAEAEATKKADAQKSVEATKKKAHFETALDNLNILKVVAIEEADAQARQNELVSLLKKYKFEESMLIALPAALAKAPDSRGQFDHMAIGQLEGEIRKNIAEQESVLLAAKPDQDKCDAAVRKAQDVLNSARAKQRDAAKKYDSASKHEISCEEASTAAQKAVRDLTRTSDKLKKEVLNAEVEVECFQQGPKETFRMLRERTTPPPVVEEPEVEEQAMEQEAEVPAVEAS